MSRLLTAFALVLAAALPAAAQGKPGILLLAHGGNETWNGNVLEIVRALDREQPAEVAFGMATRANIQDAVTKLEAKGATEIIAVPLFISSHSSIVRATGYLLGLRSDAPPELERYAKMSHGSASGAHASHAEAGDGTKPIVTKLRVRMTPALDDHPLVGAIAADRARSISRTPANEAVILAVHGPVPDGDNEEWLKDLRVVASHVKGYAAVDVVSLRDDAPAPVRDAATAELRAMVTKHRAAGHDVLIVPVLLSYGGIEEKLKSRLQALEYRIPAQGIAPDARLVEWVRQMTRTDPSRPVPTVTEAVLVQGRIGAALPLEPKLPGSFDVLGKDDLVLTRPLTVNEALRKVPGVAVRDEEGLGLRPNIGIRGLNPTRSTKVLLLEDGLPITYAPYGDNASYYHPPLARFEAVEVLKGSGQIAYGPSTIGGVINYLTPLPPSAPAWMVAVAAGNRGFLDGDASFGTTAGRVGYFLALHGRGADGSRDAIHSNVGDTSGKATFAATPRQLFVARASHYRERSRNTYSGLRQAEFEANPRQNPFVNDRFHADRAGASLTHHLSLADGVMVAWTAYLSRFARDWWRQSSNSAQRPNDAADPNCGGMANLSTTCGNEGRLRRYIVGGVESRSTIGLGARGELDFGARLHGESQDRLQKNGDTPTARDGRVVEDNERSVLAVSAFVQHRFAAGPLAITPGVRVENVHFERRNLLANASGKTSLTQIIPGIGVAASLGTRALLFAGLHRGFAPPRVEDAITNSGGTVDLDSELSWNSELGLRGELAEGLRADVTLFRMDYENQIVPASLAGGVGATLTNGGETLHQGLELGLRGETASPARAGDRVYARVAYTFLPVAKFTGSRFSNVAGFGAVSVSGNRLPYAPEHLATVTGGYRFADRADVFVEMVSVSSQFGDDLNTLAGTANGQRGLIERATTWNAGANVTVIPGRLTGYVTIYNLADRLYIVDRSRGIVPSPPRRMQMGARVTF